MLIRSESCSSEPVDVYVESACNHNGDTQCDPSALWCLDEIADGIERRCLIDEREHHPATDLVRQRYSDAEFVRDLSDIHYYEIFRSSFDLSANWLEMFHGRLNTFRFVETIYYSPSQDRFVRTRSTVEFANCDSHDIECNVLKPEELDDPSNIRCRWNCDRTNRWGL